MMSLGMLLDGFAWVINPDFIPKSEEELDGYDTYLLREKCPSLAGVMRPVTAFDVLTNQGGEVPPGSMVMLLRVSDDGYSRTIMPPSNPAGCTNSSEEKGV